MPAVNVMNCLAAFLFPLLAAAGWYTGSWVIHKILK